MGSQIPGSNDRSRTYWTPTMERYFVDLMLEHMHRGNRVGHTFNKQAWTDMLTVFNAKFGSQYDKDVIKTRYTSMWKQFNDVKNLLSQNGFCWDEQRQMVVAEDHVWDAYIKVHPEARMYKTKAVLNFNDLCLIYEYTMADGRYSLSSHDIDNDDELQGLNLGDGIASFNSLNNNDRSRTDWTNDMDHYFIELMLNQLERGNKLDYRNTFSKQAWTDIVTLFNAKYGSQHSKRVLRHRYKKLWKYYNDVTVLLGQNGFSWNEEQQMVVADNDTWDAYVKAHPFARSYRGKPFPNYQDLVSVFGDVTNTGTQSALPREKDLEDNIIGSKIGSERSRTYWTPPMDLYLIDLLVDQVRRGNRIGQTFIGQAWVEMAKAFNTNFNSHLEKDVLKNRYKHFRRQYNDVKTLLEHADFLWDEKREMVTAKDDVWDAYIKAHPDVRSYRVKTVPSYHKLCCIFGQERFNGRSYSLLACNRSMESEMSVPSVGGNQDDVSHGKAEPTINWTPSMDHCFIDVVLDWVRSENKIGQTFDGQDWSHMTNLFNEKLGLNYNSLVLEERFECLTNQYIDVCNLLEHNGFAWDETVQIITADDDVWEAYIEENPHAISYRGRILGDYNDLCIIFGNKTDDQTFICQNPKLDLEEMEESDGTKKRHMFTSPPSGRSSKVQKIGTEEIQEAFSDVANVISKLMNKKTDKNYIGIERAIDALQAIPDIDDELLLDACDLLEDERKAKTFLALDASLRKKWLLRKLSR